jgi:hypothetical protein
VKQRLYFLAIMIVGEILVEIHFHFSIRNSGDERTEASSAITVIAAGFYFGSVGLMC